MEERNTFNFSISIGYNAGMWIDDYGFSDLNLGVYLPVSLGEFMVALFFNYTIVFLEAVNENNELWFGVTIAL